LYTSNAAPALKAHLQKKRESLRPLCKSYVFYNVSVTFCRVKSLKFMSLGILGICVFIFPVIIKFRKNIYSCNVYDYVSEDSRFESWQGRPFFFNYFN